MLLFNFEPINLSLKIMKVYIVKCIRQTLETQIKKSCCESDLDLQCWVKLVLYGQGIDGSTNGINFGSSGLSLFLLLIMNGHLQSLK